MKIFNSPVPTCQSPKLILLIRGEEFIRDVPSDCSRQSESIEKVVEALSGMTDLTSLLVVSINPLKLTKISWSGQMFKIDL